MIDSAMSSLFPTHNIGADGFNWFIGQIESGENDPDPKGSGRHRVRILGQHPKECGLVPSSELGWAQTLMPVTNPHTPGGATSVSDQLESGTWVVGFFLDPERQMPVIMGSIGRVANSFEEGESADEDPTPESDGCKSFTTFIKPRNKKPFDQYSGSTVTLDPLDAGHAPDGRVRTTSSGETISAATTQYIAAKYGQNSETNPSGINWCVEIADKCGKETDLNNTFQRLFSEMLYETQRNNGKLGTYLVGEVTGELYDSIGIGRKYVTKGKQLVRTFVASAKGFVVEKMREAVKELTDALIYPSEEGNSLTPVTKFFNDKLASLGCEMADLGDRLAKFIEEIIFGYLFNIYKQTVCHVDKFINGLLGKIQSLMNELLESILGPIQDLLGAIASPFNILGDAINYVLGILGIECSGPGKKCSKTTTICTNCGSGERKDFLDNLLDDLADKPKDWNQYTCPDNFEGTKRNPTEVIFVGGENIPPNNDYIAYSIEKNIIVKEGEIAEFTVTRSGKTDLVSSVTYLTQDGTAESGVDYEEKTGVLGFVSGETSKTISVRTYADNEDDDREDFFVVIRKDTPGTIESLTENNVGRCTIRSYGADDPTGDGDFGDDTPVDDPSTKGPNTKPPTPDDYPPPDDPNAPTGVEVGVSDEQLEPTFFVFPDKNEVEEGGFVTYTIQTQNVPDGSIVRYQLWGDGITPSDIVNFTLSGTFTVNENQATVVVGINKDDNDREKDESLIFSIPNTGAQCSVLILSDLNNLTQLEQFERNDESSNFSETPVVPPSVREIITGPGGEIVDIIIGDPGTPFKEAPNVLIVGEGTSGAGIALLNDRGLLTEIRVTDPGFGYKLNKPDDARKECIIDSFTMIRPGQDYTSPPTVYVDGDNSIAEALVEEGKVISIRIKNREMTFKSYPKVIIVGGGGYGATFLPSFACLEPEARVAVGSAKIGTGSYIDCP